MSLELFFVYLILPYSYSKKWINVHLLIQKYSSPKNVMSLSYKVYPYKKNSDNKNITIS